MSRRTAIVSFLAVSLGLACASAPEPDLILPDVSGSFALIDGYAIYALGDTITLAMNGSDNQGLTWLGYELCCNVRIRDSVSVQGRSATRVVPARVLSTWIGDFVLSLFARDESGNIHLTTLGFIKVVNASRRPMTSLSLPAPVRDGVADSQHNVVYLSLPTAQQVAILDLTTRALRLPIQLFGSPWGLDLTP